MEVAEFDSMSFPLSAVITYSIWSFKFSGSLFPGIWAYNIWQEETYIVGLTSRNAKTNYHYLFIVKDIQCYRHASIPYLPDLFHKLQRMGDYLFFHDSVEVSLPFLRCLLTVCWKRFLLLLMCGSAFCQHVCVPCQVGGSDGQLLLLVLRLLLEISISN